MSYINQSHSCVLLFFLYLHVFSFQQELGASVPFLIYLVFLGFFWLSVRLLLSSPRCLSKSYTVVYYTFFSPLCIIFNGIAVN